MDKIEKVKDCLGGDFLKWFSLKNTTWSFTFYKRLLPRNLFYWVGDGRFFVSFFS